MERVGIMPRPRLRRRVSFKPGVTYFKPAGVRMAGLDKTVVTVDEFKALRLKDLECTDQQKAAENMKISQPTFNRLLSSARRKITDAIVNGKAIKIEGGSYVMVQPRLRGRGRGRMLGAAMGPGGRCICIKCGYSAAHRTGVPCYVMKCPKCGSPMGRR